MMELVIVSMEQHVITMMDLSLAVVLMDGKAIFVKRVNLSIFSYILKTLILGIWWNFQSIHINPRLQNF